MTNKPQQLAKLSRPKTRTKETEGQASKKEKKKRPETLLFYPPELSEPGTGTQNILVLDDKRDDSKPSQPSGQSSQIVSSREVEKPAFEKTSGSQI